MRLDKYLFENKFYPTRSKAKAAIIGGNVFLNNEVILEPDFNYKNQKIEIRPLKYVSRGGIKLSYALDFFNINVNDKVCLDIGCSTGGFSDCLLQRNAKFVYGVDVGKNQIDKTLISNKRFCFYEKTHFNNLNFEFFNKNPKINLIVIDVSFISLTKVFEKITILFEKQNFECVALIKPQFELTKSLMQKTNGIAPQKLHKIVFEKIRNSAIKHGLIPLKIINSPIKGLKKGNQEYFIHLKHELTC